MKKSLSAMSMAVGVLMLMVSVFAGTAGATEGGAENCDGEWVEAVYEYVVVTEGYTETVKTQVGWQRYSWTGGPHEPDTPPAFPGEGWQPNVAGDPHGVGQPGAYYRSNGNSGNGDWFYLEAIIETVTIDHPPVTEQRLVSEGYCIPATTVPPTTTVTACDTEPELCEPPDTVTPTTTVNVGTPDSVVKRTAKVTQLPETGPSGGLIATGLVGLGLLLGGLAVSRKASRI